MVSLSSSRPVQPWSEASCDRFFRFSRAEGAADREATYRIRYQVYCIERGFFDREDYPTGLEEDEFDPVSVHLLATHLSDGLPAGTARLVLNSPLGFPFLGHCELAPGYAWLQESGGPATAHYAEISRLAVSKLFRWRVGDAFYGGPPRPPSAKGEVIEFPTPCNASEILSGIHRELYQQSLRLGITHWIVAMERSLYLILARMGCLFTPIGPKVDYFGPVRPYLMSLRDYESSLHRTAPAILRYMVAGVEAEWLPECLCGADDDRDEAARSA